MKDTLKITAEYIYDTDLDLEVRTAALYTIYGLYHHQMNRPRTKIPMTPTQWIQILQFIDTINQAEHVDVEYVFRHLLHSDAFEFSSVYEIETNIPNLKGNTKTVKITSSDNVEGDVENKNEFVNSTIKDNLTDEMETIHEAYLQIKEEFLNSKATCSKLTYINSDFKNLIGLPNDQEPCTSGTASSKRKKPKDPKEEPFDGSETQSVTNQTDYDLNVMDLESETDKQSSSENGTKEDDEDEDDDEFF